MLSNPLRLLSLAIVAPSLVVPLVRAQSSAGRTNSGTKTVVAVESAPKPATGARGVVETVATIMARPERFDRPITKDEDERGPEREALPQNPLSPATPGFPARLPDARSGAATRTGGPLFANGLGFLGINGTESPYVPPDTQGDVSPTQILVAANGRIKVFDRNGVLGALNTTTDTFFQSVRTAGISDPRVRYDRLTGRWILVAIDVAGSNNRVVIAVSDASTITSTSSFTFYFFNQAIGGAPTGEFADYPTLGVDRNALYIGTNQFGNSFLGSDGFVVRKSSILSGGPIVVTHFQNLSPASGAGAYTPQGVDNDDPNATEGYFIGVDNAAFGLLQIRRVGDPGGNPTISGNVPLTVPSTASPVDVPQPNTNASLDALDDRLYLAKIQYDATTNTRTLWTAHNIGTNAQGVGTNGGRTSSRWYQIANYATGANPSLVQSGTIFDTATTNPLSYWIPSIVQSLQGNVLLGSSYGGETLAAGAYTALRTPEDPLGTLPTRIVAQTGSGTYTANRWGDYSMATIDPTDGMTFWSFQTYVNGSTWAIRTQKVLSNPPVATGFSLASLRRGQSATGTLTGTGFFDPPASYPNRLVASAPNLVVTPAYVSPTQVNLGVVAATNAPLGAKTITVTNPDGQSTTTSVNVLAPLFSGIAIFGNTTTSFPKPPITVEFLDVAANVVATTTATPAADGTFSIEPDIPAATYTVRVRAPRFLRRAVTVVDAADGTASFSVSLVNGDANNDNVITIADVNVVRAALGTTAGNAGYNSNADLNGDGSVSIADVNIVRANLGQTGD